MCLSAGTSHSDVVDVRCLFVSVHQLSEAVCMCEGFFKVRSGDETSPAVLGEPCHVSTPERNELSGNNRKGL